jgi:hypothetical protein
MWKALELLGNRIYFHTHHLYPNKFYYHRYPSRLNMTDIGEGNRFWGK